MTTIETLSMKNLLTGHPQDSVRKAVNRMTERKVGAILVVEDSKLVGIFSERDALERVLSAGCDADATRLGDVCTREPKAVRSDAPFKECVDLVKRYGVRHVPIVDEADRPVGILSSRDFLSYVINELEELIERASTDLRREELADPYDLISY